MNTATNQILMQALTQAESRLRLQAAQALRQTTLRGVILLMTPQVPSHLRPIIRQSRAARELRAACERAAQEIVTRQLNEVEKLPPDQAITRLDQLFLNEWGMLRGNFPRLFVFVENERTARRHKLAKLLAE